MVVGMEDLGEVALRIAPVWATFPGEPLGWEVVSVAGSRDDRDE